MSYTSGGYSGTVLGSLDATAMADLYGAPGSDGSQDQSWSWDAPSATLTQTGFATADTLAGVGGFNLIHGGDGDDVIAGRPSAKGDFYGDGGNDTLSAQEADAHLYGGAGDDSLSLTLFDADPSAPAASASLFGGDGADTLNAFVSTAAAANLLGLTASGGAGDDVINLTLASTVMAHAAAGSIVVDGGTGSDTLSLVAAADADGPGYLTLAAGGPIALTNVETVLMFGSDGPDVLIAGPVGTQLSGGAGDDALIGGTGPDSLYGGDPSGADQDWMHGGGGNDYYSGGSQSIADLSESRAATTLTFSGGLIVANGPDGSDTLSGVGFIHFTDGLYAVSGSALTAVPGQVVEGTAGDDVLAGTIADDTMDGGGGGNDTAVLHEEVEAVTFAYGPGGLIVVSGPDGVDHLTGFQHLRFLDGTFDVDASGHVASLPGVTLTANATGSSLQGTAGDDTLIGGAGNDTLTGGAGSDSLSGGDGIDTATYAGFARDYTITMNGGVGTVAGDREGGVDTLGGIENVQFLDGTLTFDDHSTAAEILRLYDSFLGRAPDAAGFESYLRLAQSGYTFQQLADLAASGAEFHNATASLNDTQYVTYIYEHSLHREPDSQGLQTYVTDLENGTFTRTSMIVFAAEGAEHVALTAPVVAQGLWIPNETVEGLELLYDASVQRQPDASGIASYSAQLAAGVTFHQIADQIAAGAEFQAAHAGQSDAAFIDSLYVAEVHRHADPTGLAAYGAQLEQGASRGDILYETAFGQEHQSHVLAFYDPLLVGLG